MTVRNALAAALLAGAGLLSTAPAATAACEPNPLRGEYCPGTITGQLKPLPCVQQPCETGGEATIR